MGPVVYTAYTSFVNILVVPMQTSNAFRCLRWRNLDFLYDRVFPQLALQVRDLALQGVEIDAQHGERADFSSVESLGGIDPRVRHADRACIGWKLRNTRRGGVW